MWVPPYINKASFSAIKQNNRASCGNRKQQTADGLVEFMNISVFLRPYFCRGAAQPEISAQRSG